MSLAAHTHLGPYEILALTGAGGMGEVYRARDMRLDRTVAIKVLPAHLAQNPEFRQRLEREARAVSSLNHPHICILHDIGSQDGIDFLVMEYLEGETLAARIAKGPLPVDQALLTAIQTADALDKAHRKGVTHRDFKPGNLMLTKSGAKLLDFGLAKTAAPANPDVTADRTLTAAGSLLGTFQYMSPEQLEGKDADARSDLFAFGAVLYEMITGRKAFPGSSQASVITAIMSADPPPASSLQPLTPPALDHVLRKCLAKDPDERWQSAGDLTSQLQWIAQGSGATAAPLPSAAPLKPPAARAAWIAAAVFLVAFLAALVPALRHWRETPEKRPLIRFPFSAPDKVETPPRDFPLVSPDGQWVVGGGHGEGRSSLLWARRLDSLTSQVLADGHYPFWLADSRWVAFSSQGKLKKTDLSGAAPITLCDIVGGGLRGGTSNRDGVILFASGGGGEGEGPGPGNRPVQISQVPAAGGPSKPVTTLDVSRREVAHVWPQFLPDGRRFLYLALSSQPENTGVYVASLDSSEKKRLLATDRKVVYASGYLLMMRGETLMAQAFDHDKLELRGDPAPVAEQVLLAPLAGEAQYSASENGVLVYFKGSSGGDVQMTWFDREGKRLGTVGQPADYSNPALSPDEKRLAVGIRDRQTKTRDLWVFDLVRGTSSRFTFDPAEDLNPVWSPDGNRIAFTSERKGPRNLYVKPASGIGQEEALLESEARKSVEQWSPDGRYLVFNINVSNVSTARQANNDLWLLPLSGDRKPQPLLQTPFNENQAQVSPNGRWFAYQSFEARRPEVYVQNFPPSGGKWQVSTTGGNEPQWRADGKELFYLQAGAGRLMAVDVQTGSAAFEAGIPKPLFDVPLGGITARNRYVATRDGRRFLFLTRIEDTSGPPFVAVVNWPQALRR